MTKKLVVIESTTGRLEGIDPGQATGIPIPTAQIKTTRPAAGTIAGEIIFETSTRTALLWTGSVWAPIQSDFLHILPTDAAALAGTIPIGHVAISEATGNFFVHRASGVTQWGIREYPTAAALLADSPPAGSIAVALDEHTLWLRETAQWDCLSARGFTDSAAVFAWSAADGATAIDQTYGITYHRAYGRWYPATAWPSAEASILAETTLLEGQVAIATDTGKMLIMTASGWKGMPIAHFATEAALLAATPADGTLAWGDDTGLIYARSGGSWKRVNSPTITVGNTAPTTPATGDLWYDKHRNGVLKVRDGANWQIVGHRFLRDTLANRPAYGSSDYGDLFSATDTKQLFIAGESNWVELTGGGDSGVNSSTPDKDWKNQTFRPPDGAITRYAGHTTVRSGTEHLVLAIAKPGGKFANSDFIYHKTSKTDLDNNGATTVTTLDGGGGPGGGWYGVNGDPIRDGRTCSWELTVDRTEPTRNVIKVESLYENSNNHLCKGHCLIVWDNVTHPLDFIYLSEIQGGGNPTHFMRQI